MLTTLSRKGEVMSMKLSRMRRLRNGDIKFRLDKPTKTFNVTSFKHQSGLQFITVPRVQHNSKLCPVTALENYIEKVEVVRRELDEIFIIFQDPSQPATDATVSRWCKDLLEQAGISGFGVHSTRGAMSSASLIRGIPVSVILNQAGWSSANTFVKKYLKPIQELRSKVSEAKREDEDLWDKFSHTVKIPKGKNKDQTEYKLKVVSGQITVKKVHKDSLGNVYINTHSKSDTRPYQMYTKKGRDRKQPQKFHQASEKGELNVKEGRVPEQLPQKFQWSSGKGEVKVNEGRTTGSMSQRDKIWVQSKFKNLTKISEREKIILTKSKNKISSKTKMKLQDKIRTNMENKGKNFNALKSLVKKQSVPISKVRKQRVPRDNAKVLSSAMYHTEHRKIRSVIGTNEKTKTKLFLEENVPNESKDLKEGTGCKILTLVPANSSEEPKLTEQNSHITLPTSRSPPESQEPNGEAINTQSSITMGSLQASIQTPREQLTSIEKKMSPRHTTITVELDCQQELGPTPIFQGAMSSLDNPDSEILSLDHHRELLDREIQSLSQSSDHLDALLPSHGRIFSADLSYPHKKIPNVFVEEENPNLNRDKAQSLPTTRNEEGGDSPDNTE